MHLLTLLLTFALVLASLADNPKPSNDNPNVWNFQIARKVIAAFQYNGMGMSIWEDQGVENTTVTSNRQFYVTPITEFLPNSTKCEFNDLTGTNTVTYNVQLWNDRLQSAAMDRLKLMQIVVAPEQVQPLPFYQVRMIWNNAQQQLQKASLSSTWENNLQQQSIRQFTIFTDDKATCDRISNTLQTKPDFFTSSIALQYSLSAASTATRILSVKVDHFINSQMMAALKNMDVQSPERLLTSDDANQLTMQIMDNIVASQVVDGEYVPDADQLTLKDIVNNALQLQNADVANFSQIVWGSVYWDPVYARPDKVTSYLNKVLVIDQGSHSVSKSQSFDGKGEGGLNLSILKLFNIGGHGSGEEKKSVSFNEMNAWFKENNYDVEIQGEIFIPKNLDLKKINMGVLNKQETIYTKSVQMHHVDAPGLLTVTAGALQSIGESEDIKQLKQATARLTSRLTQLEPRVGNLEPRVAQLEPRVTNLEPLAGRVGQLEPKVASVIGQVGQVQGQLNAKIDQVQASLSGALATKISACTLCPGKYPSNCLPWSNSIQPFQAGIHCKA